MFDLRNYGSIIDLQNYESIVNLALPLLNRSEKARKALIIANFELGKLVAKVQEDSRYGDNVVVKLADDLSKIKGYQVRASFLWECARVYKTFNGNLQKIFILENELIKRGIKISWTFLVKNCTPLPEPQKVLESEAYWDEKLSRWENVICEIEENIYKKEELVKKMPPNIKQNFNSFVIMITENSAVKVEINRSEKIDSFLKKVDSFLDSLVYDYQINDKTIQILKNIKSKIDKILTNSNLSICNL